MEKETYRTTPSLPFDASVGSVEFCCIVAKHPLALHNHAESFIKYNSRRHAYLHVDSNLEVLRSLPILQRGNFLRLRFNSRVHGLG